jgi:hypothetical protein
MPEMEVFAAEGAVRKYDRDCRAEDQNKTARPLALKKLNKQSR